VPKLLDLIRLGGMELVSFKIHCATGSILHLLAERKDVSVVRLCRLIGAPRSTVYFQRRERKLRPVGGILAHLICEIVQALAGRGVPRPG